MEDFYTEQLMLQSIGDQMDSDLAAQEDFEWEHTEDQGDVDKPWLDNVE